MIEPNLCGPCDDDRWIYNKTTDNRECLRRINGLDSTDMPQSFQVLLGNPKLLWAVHQLMEGDFFAASVQALVYKAAKYGITLNWHQDPINVRRFPAFNMDIYLDQATVENGCVYVIPESHLAGYHAKDPGFIEQWTDGKGIEAEKAVLGGIMLRNETWDLVSDLVKEDDFHQEEHRLIYRTINLLQDAGKPVDVITVQEAIEGNGDLPKLINSGGKDYLTLLAKETPSVANIQSYADIIKQRSNLRRLIVAADNISKVAKESDASGSDRIIDEAEERILSLSPQVPFIIYYIFKIFLYRFFKIYI